MKMNKTEKNRIQKKINATYIPVRKLIFEDNEKETDVTNNFTDYSHVLGSVELILYSFTKANPETTDDNIIHALKRIRQNPLHEFSRTEEESLEFAILYGISRGLQQKRLNINEIEAMLDWLIHEAEGRISKGESYIRWLKEFFEKKNEQNRR